MPVTWDSAKAVAALRKRCDRARVKIADRLLEFAQEEVPVDTGALLESGRAYQTSPTTSVVSFEAHREEGTNAPFEYSRAVEFGYKDAFGQKGRIVPPNPFLRRAVARMDNQIAPIIKTELGV